MSDADKKTAAVAEVLFAARRWAASERALRFVNTNGTLIPVPAQRQVYAQCDATEDELLAAVAAAFPEDLE